MKIHLSDNDTDNVIHIDPEGMSILITAATRGVTFVNDKGEQLVVCLVKDDFDIVYREDPMAAAKQYRLKGGDIL